jgi:hypothetical protein
MKTLSAVFGIFSFIGLVIGFIPCLGSLNWLNIPFATIGLIISIIALDRTNANESKGGPIMGLVLCLAAICIGMFRLLIGGGIL